ncbi:MAG: GDP-L-fucose synthase [Verrucomicrobia bacterium]|nr:GDP-L-fucose synthase [Verrucomicrobiota bacterium]
MKKRLYIAGHTGMVGSALLRAAQRTGEFDVITATRAELDLCDAPATLSFLEKHRPELVIVAAAKVGGILSNSTFPADFLYENIALTASLVHGSFLTGVKRLLYLGSSCIYPKHAPQPIPESALLTSPLEPSNEAYAIAKITGLKLCAAYRKQHGVLYHSAMPTNLYGTGDNYHPEHSHVIPGLIHRFHNAKTQALPEVVIWGSGTPLREFLYVDDLASACFHLLRLQNPPDWVNVGYGSDLTILELAHAVARTVGYTGKIGTDPAKPDGTPRKLMDSALLRSTGWKPTIDLESGLRLAYADYLEATAAHRLRSV